MKRWHFWLGLLISLACLYFLVLPQQNFAQLWDSLRGANYLGLIPGITVYFIGVWVRAWRLHYMLRPIKQVPIRILFPIVCIGYMGNNIYPARAGELLLRTYLIKQKEGVANSVSLAIVLIERMFDSVVMMLFIFVNLPELATLTGASSTIGNIQELALVGTAVFFGALIVFLLAAMCPAITSRAVAWSIGQLTPSRFR